MKRNTGTVKVMVCGEGGECLFSIVDPCSVWDRRVNTVCSKLVHKRCIAVKGLLKRLQECFWCMLYKREELSWADAFKSMNDRKERVESFIFFRK